MSYTYELGGMKAQCMLDKKYGNCSGNCNRCERYGRLQRCYNTLNDFEKMVVDDTAKFRFKNMEKLYRIDRSNRRWETFGRTILIGLILWMLFGIAKCSVKKWLPDITSSEKIMVMEEQQIIEEPDRIWATITETHENLRDMNGDDKINCTDYAILFKVEWDKKYEPSDCEIVRNKNDAADWHHLFVRCKKDGEWLCIEPQSKTRQYAMDIHRNNDSYKKDLNIYGETDYWLAKCHT